MIFSHAEGGVVVPTASEKSTKKNYKISFEKFTDKL